MAARLSFDERCVISAMVGVGASAGQIADKWERVNYDTTGFLPAPNLWERLNTAGVRAVISHPVIFEDSPFSNMVYRGAERYGYSSLYGIRPSELLDDAGATLMVVYLSSVDSNAHMSGQRSLGYKRALEDTGRLWGRLARTLPPDTALIGTADHGHCDIPADGKIRLGRHLIEGMECWGDGRVLMFNGPVEQIQHVAQRTGAQYVDGDRLSGMAGRWGPAPRPRTVPNRRATSTTRYCDPARRPGRAHGRPPRRHHPTRTPHPPTSRLDQPSWDHCSHIGIASLSIQSRRVGIPPDVLRAFSYPPSVNRDAGVGGRFEGKERSTLSSGSSSSQRASPEMTADEICSQLLRLAGPLAE